MIDFLKGRFDKLPTKIYYFSDGAAAQYKNKKNFYNLCQHKNDFNILAEWHFSATAHGKGPCDGVGGTVKRLAARASLQRPYSEHIMTANDLYEWAKENISGINFIFVTMSEHIAAKEFLEERFNEARAIPCTRKLHAFIPLNEMKISVKPFSFAQESVEHPITIIKKKFLLDDLRGYVTAIYNSKWWLGYVLEKRKDTKEAKLIFLYPEGPSPSFTYPENPDVLWIPFVDILLKVNPVTPTGRTYTIPDDETQQTIKAFHQITN